MVKRFGQVMSKSAGNGVSIDELAMAQGSDAGRVYEMFIGPPEEDVEWTDAGINGVSRFLQRVWRLAIEPGSIVVEGGESFRFGFVGAGEWGEQANGGSEQSREESAGDGWLHERRCPGLLHIRVCKYKP